MWNYHIRVCLLTQQHTQSHLSEEQVENGIEIEIAKKGTTDDFIVFSPNTASNTSSLLTKYKKYIDQARSVGVTEMTSRMKRKFNRMNNMTITRVVVSFDFAVISFHTHTRARPMMSLSLFFFFVYVDDK